jgi:hypothetical protein
MDQKTYDKIKWFVRDHLIPALHHELDDAVQYVAMRVFENEKASWEYCFYDWLRIQGYGDRGRVSAKTLSERSISLDKPVKDDSDATLADFIGVHGDDMEMRSEITSALNLIDQIVGLARNKEEIKSIYLAYLECSI